MQTSPVASEKECWMNMELFVSDIDTNALVKSSYILIKHVVNVTNGGTLTDTLLCH